MKRIIITLGLSLLCASAFAQGLSPNGGSGGGTTGPGIITACSASNNQLLYDNAGSCAGLATANNGVLVTNGSGVPSISTTLPAGLTITGYLPLSAGSGNALTGALFQTLGTITTSQPLTITQTWNAGGVTFNALSLSVTNTASAAASTFLDFQTGGTSQFKVRASDGAVLLNNQIGLYTDGGGISLYFTLGLPTAGSAPTSNVAALTAGQYTVRSAGTRGVIIGRVGNASSIELNSGGFLGFSAAADAANADTILNRDAAGILAQVNGANAQSFRAYNTSSSANANFERGVFGWTDSANTLVIGTQAAGTGTLRAVLLAAGSTTGGAVQVNTNGSVALITQGSGNAAVFSTAGPSQINTSRVAFNGTTSSFSALKGNATVLQVRLADDSGYTALEASTLRTATAFTVGTLPAGSTGMRAYVTDQLTTCAAIGVAPTGGGAVVCPVFYNGSAWVGG